MDYEEAKAVLRFTDLSVCQFKYGLDYEEAKAMLRFTDLSARKLLAVDLVPFPS